MDDFFTVRVGRLAFVTGNTLMFFTLADNSKWYNLGLGIHWRTD